MTKTFGLPLTLESVMGPYVAVKNPLAKQAAAPEDFLNFCLEKLFVLPVLDALPEMLAVLYTHLTVPMTVFSTIVVFNGFEELVPLTFTGKPVASLTVTL